MPARKHRHVLVTLGFYDPRFFEGIGRFAKKAGWHLATRSMLEASSPLGWKGDGMLINDAAAPRLSGVLARQARKQPTVFFGANHGALRGATVQEDNRACGRLAAEHFLERGHQHFAWFSIDRGQVQRDRRAGFCDALASAGQSCAIFEWQKSRGRLRDHWAKCRAWLTEKLRSQPRPLALYVLDDLLAADAIEACLDAGWRVPEDVAVLGTGNLQLACECSRIAVSSIDLDMAEMAYRAAEILDRMMRGRLSTRPLVLIPPRGIVTRPSSDVLAVTHPGVKKAVRFIAENFGRDLGVGAIGEASGLSRRALHYAFVEQLRTTPARHLLRTRMAEARRMLEHGSRKISEIAAHCGFQSTRNFHRRFLREMGLSPHAHRTSRQAR